LVTHGKGHLALNHVERLVFPMMDVPGRHVALAGHLLHQCEPPTRVVTSGKKRQQPAAIPNRLFEGLTASAQCDEFSGPRFSRDLRCHRALLPNNRFADATTVRPAWSDDANSFNEGRESWRQNTPAAGTDSGKWADSTPCLSRR